MVRFSVLVQACPDEGVIEHARLALECPEGATIGAPHRDGVKLVPALEAAVCLDGSFQQIAHLSSSVRSSQCFQERSDAKYGFFRLFLGSRGSLIELLERGCRTARGTPGRRALPGSGL